MPSYSDSQNGVPMVVAIPMWERHLAALTIEAGRLSHRFLPLRLSGTYFSKALCLEDRPYFSRSSCFCRQSGQMPWVKRASECAMT
jgi:hypothetical protein